MQRVVAYFAALVITVVALVVGIRLVADNTSALDRVKGGSAGAATTTVDIGPPPGPGQYFVRGTVERVRAEGAQSDDIATPFTLNAVERGAGKATIENALVDGKRTTIVWGGGTPLPISGAGGSIDLGGARVEVDAGGITWTADGTRALKPGSYRVGAPVAVGVGGLATPRDAVAFVADARTVIAAKGGVVIKLPPAPLVVTGPGKVIATGQLRVRDQAALTPAHSIQFGEGPYTVKVTPVEGRLELDAVLQGTLTRA